MYNAHDNGFMYTYNLFTNLYYSAVVDFDFFTSIINMISTGREYDRFVIALVIISVFILALYVVQCNQKNEKKLKNQETMVSDRLNYLTQQVNQTSQNMKDYMEPPKTEPEQQVEDNLPNPVSSGFLG